MAVPVARREGIRRKTLVEQRHRRLKVRVLEIEIELREIGCENHPLENDGPCRHRDDEVLPSRGVLVPVAGAPAFG